jgi:hypothetical protein
VDIIAVVTPKRGLNNSTLTNRSHGSTCRSSTRRGGGDYWRYQNLFEKAILLFGADSGMRIARIVEFPERCFAAVSVFY